MERIGLLFIAGLFCLPSLAEMTPAQAIQVLRQATDKVPLVSSDHKILEQAYVVITAAIASQKPEEKKSKSEDDRSGK